MSDVRKILDEREETHGSFCDHAACSQELKGVMAKHQSRELSHVQIEALEMIQHKIARILVGDPDVIDHWDDIAGYATLVADELRNKKTD